MAKKTKLIVFFIASLLASLVFVQKKTCGETELTATQKQAINDARAKHEKNIRIVDEAWDLIMLGDKYCKENDFSKAAEAYKKSYVIGPQAMSGLLLVKTYEKLGRFDEGLAVLNEMVNKGYLSKNGIKNANEIKARLLAQKKEK